MKRCSVRFLSKTLTSKQLVENRRQKLQNRHPDVIPPPPIPPPIHTYTPRPRSGSLKFRSGMQEIEIGTETDNPNIYYRVNTRRA